MIVLLYCINFTKSQSLTVVKSLMVVKSLTVVVLIEPYFMTLYTSRETGNVCFMK